MIQHVRAVFNNPRVSGGSLLVLLCLADMADESGACYPGIARLMASTAQCERAVQNAIKTLRGEGLLSTTLGGGRNRTTVYMLHLETPQIVTCETPQVITETPQVMLETPQMLTETPYPLAPKAPRSTKEAPIEAPAQKRVAPAFVLPKWVPPDPWDAYMEVRKKRKQPMTDYALNLLVKKLEKFRARHDIAEIINRSVESGWSSFFEPKTQPDLWNKTPPPTKFIDPEKAYL